MKPNPKYLFFIYIGIYLLFLLLNLDRIPVAWTDETQLLDPATNYVFNGEFNTNLQAYPSSTRKYAMSLPFIQWVHITMLQLFKPSIFITRFPMALAACICGILLFLYGRKERYPWILCLSLPFFFLLDINVYEMTRSGRMEIFSSLLFLLSFYWLSQKKYVLSTISTSLLILTHPASWAAGLILFAFNWLQTKKIKLKLILPILVILPSIFWLYTLHFDIEAIKEQILGQGQFHGPDVKEGSFTSNILWNRFWPFWKTQPYMIAFHLGAICIAIYNIIKIRKLKMLSLEIIFLATEIVMAFKLATHHRYNVLLVLFILLLVTKWVNSQNKLPKVKLFKWNIYILLPMLLFPFLSRNIIGVAERRERDPRAIMEWVHTKLPQKEKTLLTGSDILHYYSIEKERFTFFETIYPQQINFKEYNYFYTLTKSKPHKDAIEIATYFIEPGILSKKINSIRGTKNYSGLVLYKIPNAETVKEITAPYDKIY